MRMIFLFLFLCFSFRCVYAGETAYFPKEAYSSNNVKEDPFTHYAEWFQRGKQPSLWMLSQRSACIEFRAFDIPCLIPSGCQIYSLHINKDGTGKWTMQFLYPVYVNNQGEILFDKSPPDKPIQKTFKISKEKVRSFLDLVHKNEDFWTMPIHVDESGIADGSDAMLECVVNGKYHVVRRNGLEKGAMDNIASALFSLVKPTLKDVPEIVYHGKVGKR